MLMDGQPVTEPVNQQGIFHFQKFSEDLAFDGIEIFIIPFKKTSQNAVKFPCAASASIEKPSLRLISTSCAQGYFLSCIACLIWAIDFAGLRPLGQVRVQFMMV